MKRKILVWSCLFSLWLGAEQIVEKTLFPEARKYNEILQKTAGVSKRYLSAGLYTDPACMQRNRLVKRIEKELSILDEVPLLLVEEHRSLPGNREMFYFKFLTDKALHSMEWTVYSGRDIQGSVCNHKEIPLTPEEMASAQKLLKFSCKPAGTFQEAPHFYGNSTVRFVTIWQDAGKSRYSFAVPHLAAAPDYYPKGEEYKNICTLYGWMLSKLSTVVSEEEEFKISLMEKLYGIPQTKERDESLKKKWDEIKNLKESAPLSGNQS